MNTKELEIEYHTFRSGIATQLGTNSADSIKYGFDASIKQYKIIKILCTVLMVASIPAVFIVIGLFMLIPAFFGRRWAVKQINKYESFKSMADADPTLVHA